MQINSFISNQRYLILCLTATFFVWLIPFLIGKNASVFVTDLFYIPLSVFLVMISIYRLIQSYSEKDSPKMWAIFLISSVSMLLAEHIWALDELILGIKPFPSYADPAFLVSYLLWIPFFFMFIKPLKDYISKKIIILTVGISCLILILSINYMLENNAGTITLENTLLSSYVILDGIIFTPVSIGIILLFKRKTNFFPSLMFLAILSQLIADVIYQITITSGTYYSGSIADLFYFLAFVIFIFGVYDYRRHLLKEKQTASRNI